MRKLDGGTHFKRRKGLICYIGILFITLLLNILAWSSNAFCDAYIANVFPIWVNTYGRITGLFSFSVGEGLIVAGVLLVTVAVLSGIVWGSYKLVRVFQPVESAGSSRIDRWMWRFYLFFAWTLLIVWLIMTLNCAILYHASTFSENYFGEDTGKYSVEELFRVRNLVVERCNHYAGIVARDERGLIQYPGNIREDMADQAILAMQKLGQTYPRLEGYYPRPKPLASSDFLCQQYMQGYYFPFSMEANYNDVMYVMNKPETLCHELAHLRGYIYEDEANFISYLACIQSDNLYFQYSGYLSVLNYLNNDIYRIAQSEPDIYERACEEVPLIQMEPQVVEDNVFVLQEEWDRINAKAFLKTDTVEEVTDVFLDTSLRVHGVSDGIVSYSRVVKLLLQYYRYVGELPE